VEFQSQFRFWPEADVCTFWRDVCFGPLADIVPFLGRLMPAAPAPTILSKETGSGMEREQHKLAAIVASDVVGFSKPRADEVSE